MDRPRGDDALAANPFDWRVTSDGRVLISRSGRQVVVVAGRAADRPSAQLWVVDPVKAQQPLARATGNDRRGNERPHPPR